MEQAGEMRDTEVMPLCYTFRPRSALGGLEGSYNADFFSLLLCASFYSLLMLRQLQQGAKTENEPSANLLRKKSVKIFSEIHENKLLANNKN
tara:strand:+ start:167 stop:442 length:276 start_codon:yes stop_codon:yes gene_type:complete